MRGWLWLLVKDAIWLIAAGVLGLVVGWLLWGWRKKWVHTTEWENHERQLADVRAQHDKVEAEYRTLVARNGQLEAEYRGGGAKVIEVQAQLDAANAELAAAKAARGDLDTQVNALSGQRSDFEASQRAAADRITELETQLGQARQAHANCDSRIGALTGEINALQTRAGSVEPLTIDLTDKTTRIQALEAQVAQLQANLPHDDLNKILGIGPVINQKLHDMGVHWFHQIASWSDADVDRIGRELDFPGRIQREEWREQASEIMAGTWAREKPGSVNT